MRQPIPLIPNILWAENDAKSTFSKLTVSFPMLCVMSTWKKTFGYFFKKSPISSIGSLIPISLLTLHTVTSIVSSLINFFKDSRITLPFSSVST